MTSGAGHYQLFFGSFAYWQRSEFSFENEEFGPTDNMNEQSLHHLHLLLDEDAGRISASTDDIVELAQNRNCAPEHQHLKNRMKGSVVPNNDINW